MGVTPAMRGVLKRSGYADEVIDKMSFETASATIGAIKAQGNKTTQPVKSAYNGSNEQNKAKEFHLTPEAVKIAALNAAMETVGYGSDLFWSTVNDFENYINGNGHKN